MAKKKAAKRVTESPEPTSDSGADVMAAVEPDPVDDFYEPEDAHETAPPPPAPERKPDYGNRDRNGRKFKDGGTVLYVRQKSSRQERGTMLDPNHAPGKCLVQLDGIPPGMDYPLADQRSGKPKPMVLAAELLAVT